jgi:putative transposase
MKLASSSYYYQPVTDIETKQSSDTLLRDHIERLQQDFPGYGYRRLGRQLRREGIVVNDKKIRRVQRKTSYFPSAGVASRLPPPIRITITRFIPIS